MSNYNLLGVGNNAKTIKGDGSEYITAILYLAPFKSIDNFNVCPMAHIANCGNACLYTAGRGAMSNVKAGRIRKTVMYRDNRKQFFDLLYKDLTKFENYCLKRGINPVVRLNGTSDLNFIDTIKQFSNIQFYDYTKVYNRVSKKLPANYHITLSYSQANKEYSKSIIDNAIKYNKNMAVVFRDKNNIPKTFMNLPVVDGDKDDLRFLDPNNKPHVVALYAKGQAKKDNTGFVINN